MSGDHFVHLLLVRRKLIQKGSSGSGIDDGASWTPNNCASTRSSNGKSCQFHIRKSGSIHGEKLAHHATLHRRYRCSSAAAAGSPLLLLCLIVVSSIQGLPLLFLILSIAATASSTARLPTCLRSSLPFVFPLDGVDQLDIGEEQSRRRRRGGIAGTTALRRHVEAIDKHQMRCGMGRGEVARQITIRSSFRIGRIGAGRPTSTTSSSTRTTSSSLCLLLRRRARLERRREEHHPARALVVAGLGLGQGHVCVCVVRQQGLHVQQPEEEGHRRRGLPGALQELRDAIVCRGRTIILVARTTTAASATRRRPFRRRVTSTVLALSPSVAMIVVVAASSSSGTPALLPLPAAALCLVIGVVVHL